MIELFKMIMAKPLNGIVAALCVFALATHMGLLDVKLAQATFAEQQRVDLSVNALVLEMRDTLIRVDENVKTLKEEKVL